MANEMVLQDPNANVIPFPNRKSPTCTATYDDDSEVDEDFDAHRCPDFSQPVKLGNHWHSMATMAKIMLSGRNAKVGEAYCLYLVDDGDMFLARVTEQGVAPPPSGAKYVAGITCNSSIERIAIRLKEAAQQPT